MSLEDRVDSLELMVYRNNKAIRKEMNDRLTALEEIIKHPIYVYNPNKETPKCQTCNGRKVVPDNHPVLSVDVPCPDCAPKTICEHEPDEDGGHPTGCKCEYCQDITEPKSKKCKHGEEIIPDIQNCGKCFDDLSNFEPKPKTLAMKFQEAGGSEYSTFDELAKIAHEHYYEKIQSLIPLHAPNSGAGRLLKDIMRELFSPNGKDE